MIKLETLYILAGLMFAAFALFSLQDRSNPRRLVNFLFWGIYAITFMFGAEFARAGDQREHRCGETP
jgi:uncharacterized membrane protein